MICPVESFKLPNSPFGRRALAIKPWSLRRRKAKRGSLCRENSIKTFKKRIIEGCQKQIGVRVRKKEDQRKTERRNS